MAASVDVAIIGAGAAGLSAAYLASQGNTRVTVYESSTQLGGHANTVEAFGQPVDTGFLVYNENTYTNLCGLFEELSVPTEPSDMSFAVSLKDRTFEWSSDGLAGLFATKSNMVSPAFGSMISDMLRFNKEAPQFLARCESGDAGAAAMTMREFLDTGAYGAAFRSWYLIPQVAAVWSASSADALAFPARTFIQFCVNHSLAQIVDRPQWRTVSRRSREYVRRIAAALPADRSTILVGSAVASVRRGAGSGGRTVVRDASGAAREFDAVIFATHPADALRMLGPSASTEEAAALGAFRYLGNAAYLHTDARLMPASRAAWASWNYMGKGAAAGAGNDDEPCCVTYWLNRLQNYPTGEAAAVAGPPPPPGSAAALPQLFVTLNPAPDALPAPSSIVREFNYEHPQFTLGTLAAQSALARLQGADHVWFAGAYLGYGFHEDAVTAGLRAAFSLTGVRPRWWAQPLYSAPSAWSATLSAAASQRGSPGAVAAAEYGARVASGGIYWVDNLGNGGAVGTATRAVVESRRALCEASAAAAVAVGGQAAPVGTGFMGDIAGHVVVSQSDVLAAHKAAALGLGLHVAALVPPPQQQRSQVTSSRVSTRKAATGSSKAKGGLAPGGPSAATLRIDVASPHDFARSGASLSSSSLGGGSGSGSDGDVASDASAAEADEPAVSVSGSTAPATPAAVLARLAEERAAAAEAHAVAEVASPARPNDLSARYEAHTGETAPAVASAGSLLLARRAYKSDAVRPGARRGAPEQRAALATTSSGSSVFGVALGDRMAAGVGGYTVQLPPAASPVPATWAARLYSTLRFGAEQLAAWPILRLLKDSVSQGCILLRTPDGWETMFGDPAARAPLRARLRIHSWAFFVRCAAEADIGLGRSFIAGEWSADDLTAFFRVLIVNRDSATAAAKRPAHQRLWSAWLGGVLNNAALVLGHDNTVAGARKNISAHYDLSNDLFTAFLDPATMMYSSAMFPTTRRYTRRVDLHSTPTTAPLGALPRQPLAAAAQSADYREPAPSSSSSGSGSGLEVELSFHGTLEAAQLRKLDHLVARARVLPGHRVLDLGCGWGGLAIHLAERTGCRVHGITLSKEQLALARERVEARGLADRVTFELVDYRDFAAAHPAAFDRIISVEMVEAVGANYLGTYMGALGRLLRPGGLAVIQAITIPQARWAEYVGSADFINTFIFPGGCLVNVTQLLAAAASAGGGKSGASLGLASVDEFGLHYAETLRRWRANFNAALDEVVRPLGFDDAFIRTWNYYLTYCEAGFATQTLGLQVLTFAREDAGAGVAGLCATEGPLPAAAGRLADPIGPFVNTPETAALIPAGAD